MSPSTPPSVSIVTFANLGAKTNLKTDEILPVIKSFAKRDLLSQIICQVGSRFFFSNTRSAFPAFVRYPLRLAEKIGLFTLSRQRTEQIFDFFAARFLKRADVVFILPAQYERTIKKAHRNGSITIGIADTAHPLFNKRLNDEEARMLNVPKAIYAGLMKDGIAVNEFDYIVAMSDLVKRSYVEQGFSADRIFVAAPDIEMERFTPQVMLKDTFTVLYTAYTSPLKGLHYLVQAWNKLALPNAELRIIGGYGDVPPEYREYCDGLIGDNPTIRHIRSTPTPEQYYDGASVFAFPSLTEGFGKVTLEAMAQAIPVITTENARGIVEDAKTGFVVPIRDVDALAEKISYLYHNRDIAERMGNEARVAAERKAPFGEAVYVAYEEILRREQKI